MSMIGQICAYLKNYFCKNICHGEIRIIDGGLSEHSYLVDEYNRPIVFANSRIYIDTGENGVRYKDFLQDGQYFRIIGSVFNDGVYQYPASDLNDEVFNGTLWAMAVPADVITLSEEIEDWLTANASALNSPYQSESFGGYSYSKQSGTSADGSGYGWQNQFASMLAHYKKIRVDVRE